MTVGVLAEILKYRILGSSKQHYHLSQLVLMLLLTKPFSLQQIDMFSFFRTYSSNIPGKSLLYKLPSLLPINMHDTL